MHRLISKVLKIWANDKNEALSSSTIEYKEIEEGKKAASKCQHERTKWKCCPPKEKPEKWLPEMKLKTKVTKEDDKRWN